jgi:hypothetical protein
MINDVAKHRACGLEYGNMISLLSGMKGCVLWAIPGEEG